MAIMSGGQAVVKALMNEGIDVVFGVPGCLLYTSPSPRD